MKTVQGHTCKSIQSQSSSGKSQSRPQWDVTSRLLEGPASKRQEETKAEGWRGEKGALPTVGGNGSQHSDNRKQHRVSSKDRNQSPREQQPHSRVLSEGSEIIVLWRSPCSLQDYSTAKIRKQLKCPSVDEQIRENAVLMYAVGYRSAIERTKSCYFWQRGWTWRALC